MRFIFLILALSAFWLGLSGHFTAVFLGLGAASIALVVAMKMRLSRVVPLREVFLPRSHLNPFKTIKYSFWLLGQIILSNIAVAKIILSPRLNIQPHFVDVSTKQKTILGEVIFANSITLTPGTISVDTIEKDHIKVHALTHATGDISSLNDMASRVCAIESIKDNDNDQ